MNFVDYKCLENLIIEGNNIVCESGFDLDHTNPKDNSIVEISFLNKPCNVKISYGRSYESDGTTIGNPEIIKVQETAIKKILPIVNKLSLGIKDKLIQMIKSDANAIGYNLPKNINVLDYFKPSIIQAEGYYKNNSPRDRKIIIIDSKYKLDPEHGAAIEFINEKYSNMGQLDMFI